MSFSNPYDVSYGFVGGNPPVYGAGNHQSYEDTGVFETCDPEYLNRLENAVESLKTEVVELETKLNLIIDWMNTNLISPNSVVQDASGNLPAFFS